MAAENPAVIHMEAGAAYLAALRKLGLDPECLLWAEDEVVGQTVLVLVTTQFDRVGPLEVSKLLFKAYNLAGTPKEISPFILRLHSPEQALIQEMDRARLGDLVNRRLSVRVAPIMEAGRLPPLAEAGPAEINIAAGGMKFRLDWVYKWQIPAKKANAVDLRRRWQKFAQNVDKLAA